MRPMRKITICGVISLAAIALFYSSLSVKISNSDRQVIPHNKVKVEPVDGNQSIIEMGVVASPLAQDKTDTEIKIHQLALPLGFSNILEKPGDEQMFAVSKFQNNKYLPSDVIVYLERRLIDRTIHETERNNIANCLLNQERPNPELVKLFITMIDDASESYKWRDYSIQHLASCVPSSPMSDLAISVLKRIMDSGDLAFPGTAMLHLHLLEKRDAVQLDNAFDRRIIDFLIDEKADQLIRLTAIGLIGERGIITALPEIRKIAKSKNWSEKRMAFGALGSIGNQEDIALIREFFDAQDPLLEIAAKSAIRRICDAEKRRELSGEKSAPQGGEK